MRFEIYPQSKNGLLSLAGQGGWRWRFRAANNEIVASGESYTTKQSCLHAIELIKSTNHLTPTVEVTD